MLYFGCWWGRWWCWWWQQWHRGDRGGANKNIFTSVFSHVPPSPDTHTFQPSPEDNCEKSIVMRRINQSARFTGPWQLAYPGICNQQQQQRRSHLLTSAGTKYTLANDPLKCFFWGGYDSRPPSAKTYEHSTLNSNAGSVYAFLTYFYLALQVFDTSSSYS